MKRDISLQWFYPHPPEDVWHCLTTPELIAEWLMPNDFKPEIGHRFQFRSKPMPGWSGIVDCEVLEIEPYRRLSYSWVSGPRAGSGDINTIVTWHLAPEAGGTRLSLDHTGFKGFRAWLVSYMLGSGWKSHIAEAFARVLHKHAQAHESKA